MGALATAGGLQHREPLGRKRAILRPQQRLETVRTALDRPGERGEAFGDKRVRRERACAAGDGDISIGMAVVYDALGKRLKDSAALTEGTD